MKVITEAILRDELRASQPDSYRVPEGKILSPAAREYLQQRKIRIDMGGAKFKYNPPKAEKSAPEQNAAPQKDGAPTCARRAESAAAAAQGAAKYIDYDSGAFYSEKPEHMTQLFGNKLVAKDHPRILFRGKLDSLQALVVLNQAIISESSASRRLVNDLGDILSVMREMMRCDVLDVPFENERIIGLTHAELRERSHDPMKYFAVKQMTLPDYSMGKSYALLNQLRTAVREAEVAAVQAFRVRSGCERSDIVEGLNRLSSALHIMMCMYLADEYKK
ncbi:ATP-binding protein [Synergistes jonesii]|uniref:ATP-binding protein n=1 Tax=Synergistes jonesii TaxID=2754 RepID=UPI00248D644A|nr:ATP-binding protein [Synergistes jonesii]